MEKSNHKMKMAIIAGASQALKHKELKPKASEQEIIQAITNNVDQIISKIDEEFNEEIG